METRSDAVILGFLKLIAHDIRWQMLLALASSDLRVQEITQGVGQPQNLVSYHLRKLKQAGLVQENHSLADARSTYYRLNYGHIQRELERVGKVLFPMSLDLPNANLPRQDPIRVLFVCTHNSARSQMAEGLLRAWGGGRIQVFSAGSDPRPVHAFAIRVMQEKNVDIRQQQSKGIETVSQAKFDFLITVCDLARENCPALPGKPAQIHWSIPDPAASQGPEEERLNMFRVVADDLAERVHFLLGRLALEKNE